MAEDSPGGRKVIIPLSTKREAENLVSEYLRQRTATDNKLRLSRPEVQRVIYIPVNMSNGLHLPSDFGDLIPDRLKRVNKNTILYI